MRVDTWRLYPVFALALLAVTVVANLLAEGVRTRLRRRLGRTAS